MTTAVRIPVGYFGNKRAIAHIVWEFFHDVTVYAEPFLGSGGVLLNRPQPNRIRKFVLGDLDGSLVNMWRALRFNSEGVRELISVPQSTVEIDGARLRLHEKQGALPDLLRADPQFYDLRLAADWMIHSSAAFKMSLPNGNFALDGGRVTQRDGISFNTYQIGNRHGVFVLKADELMEQAVAMIPQATVFCDTWENVLASPIRSGNLDEVGVFLDPPYEGTERVYATRSLVSDDVRRWCIENPSFKTILCGYDEEHDELLEHGWEKRQGIPGTTGFAAKPLEESPERIWVSPTCTRKDCEALLW